MTIGKEALDKARAFIKRDGEHRRDMLSDDMALRLAKREGRMRKVQTTKTGGSK